MENKQKAPRPAIFLHIQKTAGSSIVELARQAYGSDEVVSHGDFMLAYADQGLDKAAPTGGSPSAYFRSKPFVSGHFGFDYAKLLMRERYSFTFLRDPVERILSFYYFCRTRDPGEFEIYALAQEITLDQFLLQGLERSMVKDCIWNNQAWQLAYGYGDPTGRGIPRLTQEEILDLAIRHLDEFSHIGFAETFETDRDCILNALGIVPPKEKIVSNATPGRPTAKDLPPATLAILNELTHLDRALYREAWIRKKTFFRKYVGKWRSFIAGSSSRQL